MKKLLVILSFISLMGIFIVSCDTTEVEEVVDYTYSISKVFWSDAVDNNKDGYLTNNVLTIHINLEENVTRNIDVRLYFTPIGGTNFTFYG